jgi:hypothetical protein
MAGLRAGHPRFPAGRPAKSCSRKAFSGQPRGSTRERSVSINWLLQDARNPVKTAPVASNTLGHVAPQGEDLLCAGAADGAARAEGG